MGRAALLLALAHTGCVMLGPADQLAWEQRFELELEPELPTGGEDLLEAVGSFVISVQGEGWERAWTVDVDDPGARLALELPTPTEPVRFVVEGYAGHSGAPEFQLLRGCSAPMVVEGGATLALPLFLAAVGELSVLDAPAGFGAALAGDHQGSFYAFGGSAAGLSDDEHASARDQILRFSPAAPRAEAALVAIGPLLAHDDDTGGAEHGGRMNATATLLRQGEHPAVGRILVVGGWEAFGRVVSLTGAVLSFDPEVGEVAQVGTLSEPRAGHAAFELDSGLVVIAGGYAEGEDGALGCARTVEVWDPALEAVTAISDPLDACLLDGAGASLGDAVLWCGGVRWDEVGYGAEGGCWLIGPDASVSAAPSPVPGGQGLLLPAMASLGAGRALLAGGALIEGSLPTLATGDEDWAWAGEHAWIYDHHHGQWKPTRAGMHQPRAGHTAVGLSGQRVLVAGGARGLTNTGTNVREPSACAEVYDLASNSWELIQPCSGDLGALSAPVHRPSVAYDPVYGALILGGLDYRQAAPDMGLYAPGG
jgi:hypothetical protein